MKRKVRRRRSSAALERVRAQALLKLGVTDPRELHLKTLVRRHIERVFSAANNSVAVTAELLDVSRRTLQRLRKEGKIRAPARPKPPHRPPKREKARSRIDGNRVIALRNAGATWEEIARELGCSAYGAQLAAKRLQPTNG